MQNQQLFPKAMRGIMKVLIMCFSMGFIGLIIFNQKVSWLYVLVVMVWGYFHLVKKMNQWIIRNLFRKGVVKE